MDKEEVRKIKQTYKLELAELKKSKRNVISEVTSSLLEEDNRAHIKVDLRNEDIYEPYSGKRKINRALFDHVKDEIGYIKPSVPVTIDFIINEEIEPEIENISSLFSKMANFEFTKSSVGLRRNKIVVGLCMLLGIILLIAYELFMFFTKGNFFGEIISIACWVFIWEAVDAYVFTRFGIQKEGLINCRIATSKIEFHIKDKKK